MTENLPELTQSPDVCPEQKRRTLFVEQEARRMANRMEDQHVASVFSVNVYAFNCSDKRHDLKATPHPFHLDYIAGGGRLDVPGALNSTIRALEHCLAELKKRAQ